MIITISGKAASGKSTLAKYLAENLSNSVYLELDHINQKLFSEQNVKDYAVRLFGKNVIQSDGSFDTKVISDHIYTDEKLYNMWHDYMLIRVDEYLDEYVKNSHYDYYILEHVLIYESKFYTLADIKICAQVEEDIRLERVSQRDNLSHDEVMKREKFVDDTCFDDYDMLYDGSNEQSVLDYIIDAK